jgi:hypothetical protein
MTNTDTNTPAPFDPAAFEDVPQAECVIKTPSGEPTAMVVLLQGPENPERKRRLFARQRRLRQEISQQQRLPVTDPEEEDADDIEEMVACTIGWRGCALPFSVQAARELYSDPKRQYLRLQVRAFLDRRDAFTLSSARG